MYSYKIILPLLSFLVFAFIDIDAQSSCNNPNLVPNPSFEQYNQLQCDLELNPSTYTNNVDDWINPIETTPDIFSNQNSQSCWAHTPHSTFSGSNACNRKGLLPPRTGDVVTSLQTYSESSICAQGAWNEYIQTELTTPLYPGKTYNVNMFAVLTSASEHATDGLGFHFSDTMVNTNSCVPLDLPTHVGANNVLNNDSSWHNISGTFSPQDTIHYLVIGNFDDKFYSKTNVQTNNANPNDSLCNGAVYFIDDISVCEKEQVVELCNNGGNLIPNPGFEQYNQLQCNLATSPSSFTNKVVDWSNPTQTTPDLFSNQNSQSCYAHIPNSTYTGSAACNRKGLVQPRNGNTVAMLQTYKDNAACAQGTWNEYFQVELVTPMYPGKTYNVSMFAALASSSHHATDGLGFHFSDTMVNSNSCVPLNLPTHVATNNVLHNDSSWHNISGTFSPQDTIRYVVIGNFDDKFYSNTTVQPHNTQNNDPECNCAAYFIDDVSVCETQQVVELCNNGGNFIPNPGFEQYNQLQCNLATSPSSFTNKVVDWSNPTQTTPDLFTNQNSQSCYAHIPNSTYTGSAACNRKGLVQPRNGNAVAMLQTYKDNAACAQGTWNEYFQVELLNPLYPGQTYNVSMFAALASSSHHATDGLGFHFSDTMVNSNSCVPLNLPTHVATNNVLHNDSSWHEISGTFSPQDTIRYLVIGNFDDKFYSNTTVQPHNTQNNDPECNCAAYFIDDVSICEKEQVVELCDNDGGNLAPNPSFEQYNQLQCNLAINPSSFTNKVIDWSNPIETTPDIFSNQNNQSCWAHIPNSTYSGSAACNRKGLVQPRSGNMVASLQTYSENAACAQGAWNEYIQAELVSPLYPGKTYNVSMFAALSSSSHHATDGLGFHFSDTMVHSNGCVPLDLPTHVAVNSVLHNDTSWHKISGTFSPQDTIRYMVIGNFDDKFYSNTTVQPHNMQNNDPNCNSSTYFIDDISICEKEQVVTCGSESLITNTSFENYNNVQCNYNTSSSSFTNNLDDWNSPTATTPDLVTNTSSQSCWAHIPNSTYSGSGACDWESKVGPKDGNAAVLLVSYSNHGACTNNSWTEYIQTQLFSQITPGQLIYAEMYVSHTATSHHAIDNLGFHFSNNAVSSTGCAPLDLNAQIKTNKVIKNDSSWVKISGSFVATDTINYLTIGNFDDSNYSNTQIQLVDTTNDPNCAGAHYLVDDVNVCLGTTTGDNTPDLKAQKDNNRSVSIYPNPAQNAINIDARKKDWNTVRVYNTMGQVQIEGQFSKKLNISSLSKGIYFIELTSNEQRVTKKFIKK